MQLGTPNIQLKIVLQALMELASLFVVVKFSNKADLLSYVMLQRHMTRKTYLWINIYTRACSNFK
jgi:hypothetical protein